MKRKDWITMFIPFGMMIGTAAGVLLGIFMEPVSRVFAIALGSGAGLMLGIVAFGVFQGEQKK
ncbi:hypothetical protein [Bhargavaea cecembensis]|uniref:hypothetical protein n=1 Tax=Bhargavaea cecembensis TaxID=394098 RepID=UPI00058BAE8D|nr:hypothetical protein [Bhargavaea cecembensis]